MPNWTRSWLKPVALSLALGTSVSADALPKAGSSPENARVEDVDGKELKLAALKGTPLVVVYEDRDSGSLNDKFKAELAELTKDDKVRAALRVTPVADVSEYNSWPAKGFVKDAIREQSKKLGTTIWCDWDGSFRKALSLVTGTSSIVIFGRDGKVRFASQGKLTDDQRQMALNAAKQVALEKAE